MVNNGCENQLFKCIPRVDAHTPRASAKGLGQPLHAIYTRQTDRVNVVHLPALKINRLSELDLKDSQAVRFSQSVFAQQQLSRAGGSGDGTLEKLVKASVRSSTVAAAWSKLLVVRGDSGVSGRYR